MAYTTNHLDSVEQSPEPEIPQHGYDDEAPHNQGCVPSLGRIVWVIEDHQALNHVRKISWTGRGSCGPGENGNPSYKRISSDGRIPTQKETYLEISPKSVV
jgi:hypothetical protein